VTADQREMRLDHVELLGLAEAERGGLHIFALDLRLEETARTAVRVDPSKPFP
jgi:hypothetical protein